MSFRLCRPAFRRLSSADAMCDVGGNLSLTSFQASVPMSASLIGASGSSAPGGVFFRDWKVGEPLADHGEAQPNRTPKPTVETIPPDLNQPRLTALTGCRQFRSHSPAGRVGTEGKGEMTNAFSSMEYPHWLMVAGAVLLALGFVGLAIGQRKGDKAIKEMANENEQGRFEFEAEPAQTQAANRKAKLAEKTRERWARKGQWDDD